MCMVMVATHDGIALGLLFARRLLRVLPPFLAYRIHHRFLHSLEGSGAKFDERALFGRARIESTMTSVEDSNFAIFGTMNFKGLALARYFVKPGDTIFEIGANVGTETLSLAHLVGSIGRVVAVEADPRNADILRQRVESNGLTQVVIVRGAAWDRAGTLMTINRVGDYGGQTYVSAGGDGEQVTTTTMDEVAKTYGAPTFVFSDIEGAEVRMLSGGRGVLGRNRPPLFSEVASMHLERAGSSVAELVELMNSLSYDAYDTDHPWMRRVTAVPETPFWSDWLFLPRERTNEVGRLRALLLRARALPRLPFLSPLA